MVFFSLSRYNIKCIFRRKKLAIYLSSNENHISISNHRMRRLCNRYKCELATNDNRRKTILEITDNFRHNHISHWHWFRSFFFFCLGCAVERVAFFSSCRCMLHFSLALSLSLSLLLWIPLKSNKWKIVLTWIGFYVLCPSMQNALANLCHQCDLRKIKHNHEMVEQWRVQNNAKCTLWAFLVSDFLSSARWEKSDFLPFLCWPNPTVEHSIEVTPLFAQIEADRWAHFSRTIANGKNETSRMNTSKHTLAGQKATHSDLIRMNSVTIKIVINEDLHSLTLECEYELRTCI